jgi:hypothetical protein
VHVHQEQMCAKFTNGFVNIAIFDIPYSSPLMLDLGAKQVCNEINFVQLIDIN